MDNTKLIIDNVKSGNANALSVYVEVKRMEENAKYILAEIQELAIAEAEKYPEKTIHAFGATIEKRNGPSTWDYSNCQAYIQCKERLKYIERISKAGGGADSDSGEIIDKAIKLHGKPTIAISFK